MAVHPFYDRPCPTSICWRRRYSRQLGSSLFSLQSQKVKPIDGDRSADREKHLSLPSETNAMERPLHLVGRRSVDCGSHPNWAGNCGSLGLKSAKDDRNSRSRSSARSASSRRRSHSTVLSLNPELSPSNAAIRSESILLLVLTVAAMSMAIKVLLVEVPGIEDLRDSLENQIILEFATLL